MRMWILAVLLLAACASDPDSSAREDAASADAAVALGKVSATVHYQGTRTGSLIVAVFRENPPVNAPLAYQRIDAPVFPRLVELRGLEPGPRFVIAVLDSPPTSATLPGPEDLTRAVGPLDLGAEVLQVTIALDEAPGGDAGP